MFKEANPNKPEEHSLLREPIEMARTKTETNAETETTQAKSFNAKAKSLETEWMLFQIQKTAPTGPSIKRLTKLLRRRRLKSLKRNYFLKGASLREKLMSLR